MANRFLAYHEPSASLLLTLVSFLCFLPLSSTLLQKLLHASLLGPLILGVIYGVPLTNILPHDWQETFLALGYLGLIVIVLEGGLTTRIDLLRQNLVISLFCALTGIGAPIGLSIALLSGGFGYEVVEGFVLGAALSATSLGTTFAILNSANTDRTGGSLGHTRAGTIIMSAAMIDDVVGLIMASVIESLGSSASSGIGWTIGRPILVAVLMTALTPLFGKFCLEPIHRRLRLRLARWGLRAQFVILILLACGFCAIASYAGTSILYGAYLAGTVMAYVDASSVSINHTPSVSGEVTISGEVERGRKSEDGGNDSVVPSFHETYEAFIAPIQRPLLEPLFFASIGFAIPFLDLWDSTPLWRGIVYSLLMLFSKAIVGIWLVAWTSSPNALRSAKRLVFGARSSPSHCHSTATSSSHAARDVSATFPSALLVGAAMVARGEIGLLILQIGYNTSGKLSNEGFIVGNWAVVLNTIIGPLAVGVIVKIYRASIMKSVWGMQE